MTAPTTPVARPSSTGRSGAGTNAAGTVSPSAVPACLVCGGPSVPGDDVALCKPHGGLGPAWADFDEAAWLAGREAC